MSRIPTNIGGPAKEEPQTLSLLSGVAGGAAGISDAELLEADKKRKGAGLLTQTPVLIGAVAIIAAGSLFAMRATGGDLGGGNKELEAKIENWLIKAQNPKALDKDSPLLPENQVDLFKDTDTILAMFQTDFTDRQVPVEYVKKNPFVLEEEQVAPGAPVDTTSRDRAKKLEALNRELATLQLQTVMVSGTRTVAVINGDFKQPGDAIGSFKLTTMDTLSVTLTAEGETFKLTLENAKSGQ